MFGCYHPIDTKYCYFSTVKSGLAIFYKTNKFTLIEKDEYTFKHRTGYEKFIYKVFLMSNLGSFVCAIKNI